LADLERDVGERVVVRAELRLERVAGEHVDHARAGRPARAAPAEPADLVVLADIIRVVDEGAAGGAELVDLERAGDIRGDGAGRRISSAMSATTSTTARPELPQGRRRSRR
jgi:hypothetical protein